MEILDKVIKKSGKPFKYGGKIGTIKEFTINPNCNKQAVVIAEDNSIVNIEILEKWH